MSQGNEYQSPVYQHGLPSAPPSTKPTMQTPDQRPPPSWGFSQFTETPRMTPSHAQMELHRGGPPVTSPLPTPQKPYPVPTPKATEIEDEDDFESYREWKRQNEIRKMMAKQQRQSEPVPQSQPQPPPQTQHSQPQPQYSQYQLQHGYEPQPPSALPPHYQHQQQQGYGWGSQPYNQPPPPQSYVHSTRPGNKYGTITARGNAKVLMGDVDDMNGRNPYQRSHEYAGGDMSENSDIVAGGMTHAQMRDFFRREPRN